MFNRFTCGIVLLACTVALASACSSKKNPVADDPGGGGGTDTLATASDSARFVTLNSIDSVADLLDGVTPESLATALLAWVSSRPEFEATGQQGTSVWARFDDGRMLMIPNNRFPDTLPLESPPLDYFPPDPPPPLPVRPLPPRRIRAPRSVAESNSQGRIPTPTCGLPHSTKVVYFQSITRACYSLSAPYIFPALEKAGYRDVTPFAQVNELAQVEDIGVFHIDSHGGVCESRNGVFVTAIWTLTDYSVGNDATFRSQLDSDELVYMYARGALATGGCGNQWRYAFTGKFVAAYMSFPPNSIVYIGACHSDAASLRNGFKTAGASVYCGWTQPVTDRADNKASEFLFDRLAGSNTSDLSPQEVPKQRAFDLASVHQDMISRGLDFDLKTISELHITELNPGFGILSPSIRYAYVVPFTDTLFLTGYFGEDPGSRGHVFVGGVELPIYKWEPTFIWAGIPRSGPGWAGTMVVQVDPVNMTPGHVRQSNKVNLTGWAGEVTYTRMEQGSLRATLTMFVSFRADVHSFRDVPNTTPERNPLNYFGGDLSSYAVGFAEGQYQYVVPTAPPDPPEILTYTWDNTTPAIFLPPTGTSTPDPNGTYLLQGNVDASDSLNLLLFCEVGSGGLPSETLVSSKYGHQYTAGILLTPLDQLYDSPTANLHLGFGSGWSIAGETRTANVCCSAFPYDFGSPEVVHTLSWPTFVPTAPPDPTEAQ